MVFGCSLKHSGSNSHTRDWTDGPCTGIVESYPLDHQGGPLDVLYFSCKCCYTICILHLFVDHCIFKIFYKLIHEVLSHSFLLLISIIIIMRNCTTSASWFYSFCHLRMFGNFQLLVPPNNTAIDITANVSVPMLEYLQDQQWEMELLSHDSFRIAGSFHFYFRKSNFINLFGNHFSVPRD